MSLQITTDLVSELIYGRTTRFFQSDADDKYKRFLHRLDIIPYVNNRRKSHYGFANVLPDTPSVRRYYKIDEDATTFKFENERCFAILEVCPKRIMCGPRQPRTELRETVAHEMAHILEMRVYGWENRQVRFHGPKWKYFAERFGCLDLDYND